MRTPDDEDFDQKMQMFIDFILSMLAITLVIYVIHSLLT